MVKFIKRTLVALSFATITLQFSCAPTPQPHLKIGNAYAIGGKTYQPKIQPEYKEVGYASWYGHRFNKKRTANGEVFDMHDYTGAHRTLPLPSVVRVTNLTNGKSILLRINDRGPFSKGRIIDVSKNAAQALGFYANGTAKVMVQLDKEASLELLKDPKLRIREAEKKLLVEAYTKTLTRSSKKSHTSLATKEQSSPEESQTEELSQDSQQPATETATPKKNVKKKTKSKKAAAKALPKKKPQAAQVPASSPQTEAPQPATETTPAQQPQTLEMEKTPAPSTVATPEQQPTQSTSESQHQPQPTAAPQKAAPKKTNKPTATKTKKSSIRVASTTSLQDANNIRAKLKDLSSKISEADINGKKYYRVTVTTSDAKNTLNNIKAKGFKDAFITKN